MFRLEVAFCFLICITSIQAQTSTCGILHKSLLELKATPNVPLFKVPRLPKGISRPKQAQHPIRIAHTFSVSEQYYEHLGFFCKVELRLEQASHIPIKFRLGEVQYVERLEGKYD